MTLHSSQLRRAPRWISIPLVLALAACSGGSKSASQGGTLSTSAVKDLAIIPGDASIPAGTRLPFVARAQFVDGTTRDVSQQSTWTAADPAVVSFPQPGVAIATLVGTTKVTVDYQGIQRSASLTVTPGLVLAMTLNPAVATVAKGTSQQFSVFAVLSDGKQDVTQVAIWKTSNPAIASLGQPGAFTGVAAGTVMISATFGGAVVSAPVTVTNATLQSLTLEVPGGTAGGITVPAGIDVSLGATGVFSDGTSQSVTTQAQWTSSDPSVATVSQDGVVHPVAPGTAVITVERDGASASVTVTVTDAVLQGIALTPPSLTLAKNTTAALRATGTFSDGTTRDVTSQVTWGSSDTSVVTIAAGVVTARAPGAAVVAAATADGALSATASVTVTDATLVSMAVTPGTVAMAAGLTQQLTATGTFSDGTSQDLTATVGWTSTNVAVAAVSNAADSAGVVSGLAPGTATIRASLSGVNASAAVTISNAALRSIVVSGPTSLAKGMSATFKALGTFTDGSTKDVTSLVAWSSTNQGVVAVSSGGVATGLVVGGANVVAQAGAISGSAAVTVTAVTLQSITVSPGSRTLPVGATQQFVATGVFSDQSSQNLTSQVTWKTSDAAVATISSAGLLTAMAQASNVTVTAALSGISGAANVTVSQAVVVGVLVTPPSTSVAKGTTTSYVATASYSDGSSQVVTGSASWSTASSSIATVAAGVATGVGTGNTTVQASFGGYSGSAALTVTDATLSSLSLSPAKTTVAAGVSVQFTATGSFSDGSTQDLTGSVAWTAVWAGSGDPAGSIDAAGKLSKTSPGTITVTATDLKTNVQGSATVTVTDATLTGLTLSPANPAVYVGFPTTFSVTAWYTDGSHPDVTTSADTTWSLTGGVTLSGSAITGTTAGPASVKVSYGGATATAQFTVQDATLASIEISPASSSTPMGIDQQLKAWGVFQSSGTAVGKQDLSTQVQWATSDSNVATVTAGLVHPVRTGTVTITATLGGITGSTQFSVTNATLQTFDVLGSTKIATNTSTAFQAMGLYSDESYVSLSGITWSSSNPSVAVVDPKTGVAYGAAAGTATITATFSTCPGGNSPCSGSTTLSVVQATLQSFSIAVSPSLTQPAGLQFALTATAKFADASSSTWSQDVTQFATWISGSPDVAQFEAGSDPGVLSALKGGTSVVTASYAGGTASVTVTVTDAYVKSITVTGASTGNAVPVGYGVPFTATASYSDGTTKDVTSAATWTSSNTAYATVSNASGTEGVVTGVAANPAVVITATFQGVAGTVSVPVVNVTLGTITVTASNDVTQWSAGNLPASIGTLPGTIAVGGTGELYAIGTFQDAANNKVFIDMTNQCQWRSAPRSVAWVSNVLAKADSKGVVTGVSGGSATITAHKGNKRDTATVNVGP